ncbi:unnamed protein product [Acanthoscelides obtectus]|nr:unnamed protein product [Acanthoscelides obtectus]CAK1666141.1 Sialic acid synthase [Acanthoscelides obtectus]
MDIKSLEFLVDIGVPFVKIGSGDANNFLLIEEAARKNIPLVISTGMQSFETVKWIYDTVSRYKKNFALLHCVSAYPTPFEDINLRVLKLYQEEFPDIVIGYSGHELGIDISAAAVALGSKIIERHITLDKQQKGSDHKCSLELCEFKQLVTNIRNLEKSLGQTVKKIQPSEMECFQKLGKTIVYSKDLLKGHMLVYGDLDIKVAEPGGVDGSEINNIYGKILNTHVLIDENLQLEHLVT